jgi:hypothetical protein
MTVNRSASVLAKLLDLAKRQNDDYNAVLSRFGLERLLHRLSLSPHANNFLLKGALLFPLWYQHAHRPTKDADLLGFGSDDSKELASVFQEIAAIELNDGIVFDVESVRAEPIREDLPYGGTRIKLRGLIGSARCALQVDVGFGDAVTPGPETVDYPTLLPDFGVLTLRVYPMYTVIAEKFHAMVVLGMLNTRMKDFYDVMTIANRSDLDGSVLSRAIAATFSRRATPLPASLPTAFGPNFAESESKQLQWRAFLRKNRLQHIELGYVVATLGALLWPAVLVAASGSGATARWNAKTHCWV